MSGIKYMDVKEFRRLGYLQELNRRFLHPLGLALAVGVHEDGTEVLAEIWDYRDDPEGIRFEGGALASRALLVADEWASRSQARVAALGYMIQPTGPAGK
jgi:hypothetical protein